MAKKTPSTLRADAAGIRENCARMLVHADQLERDAKRLEEELREQAEAKAVANAELIKMFFLYRAQLKLVH